MVQSNGVRSFNAAKLLLAAFFVSAVILPVAMTVVQLGGSGGFESIASQSILDAAVNSLVSAFVGTLLCILMALAASFALARSRVKGKGAIAVLLTLPMLIPSIAHGMGLVFLYGSNGIITNLLGSAWEGGIYGLPGIAIGSILYAFPPAFLMLYDALRYEDCLVYDAADILGVPKVSQFFSITFPYLKKPLISAVFATFTLIVTDYGVPLEVGGKFTTLSVLMYQEVVGMLNYETGIAIGSLLLVPAMVAFIFDVAVKGQANLNYIAREKRLDPSHWRDGICSVFLVVLIAFLAAPLIAFTFVAFATKYPIDMSFTLGNMDRAATFGVMNYWFNSLIVALLVSAIGTVMAWFAAYVSARTSGGFGRVVHLICITTLAIPGMVLGLAYMLSFSDTPLRGTLLILVLVNLVHFFASPYLLAYNALNKVNTNLEAVGLTLGIPRSRLILDVFLPQTKGTVMEMASYFFVNCMVTISAVSFLASVSHMPLALLISDFDSQLMTECAALVALLIFATNVVAKVAFYVLRKMTIIPSR